MSAVFEPVRLARAAWERTQPQMFFEVDDLTTRSAVEQLVAREPHKLEVAGSSPARALLPEASYPRGEAPAAGAESPAVPINNNGSGHAHSEGAREAGASQETS